MSLLHFRRVERRRSARATVCMNVVVFGDQEGGAFRVWAKTTSVSEHGGVVALESALDVGQKFQIENEHNSKKAWARVVAVRATKEDHVQVSFEFVEGGERFWSMSFPAAGAKPMRRLVPRAAQGG